VDKSSWQGAVAASVLMAKPLGVPILLSDGGKMPPVSSDTLKRLKPTGAALARNAQLIRIGDSAARPGGYRTAVVPGANPFQVAAGIDRFFSVARGKPAPDVIVVSADQAAYAMPAAAWAARSGDSVLFVQQNSVPAVTKAALERHSHPNIYVLGPPTVVGPGVVTQLSKLGSVQRIDGPTPVQNAIAFTRFDKHGFGWGITTPGQNFTLASTLRPADAAGAAAWEALRAGGTSRAALAAEVLRSPEAAEGLVKGYYQGFLGRAADRAGLAAFATALEQGAPAEQVLTGLLASGEYFGRAQS
jgi:hypothetical protein